MLAKILRQNPTFSKRHRHAIFKSQTPNSQRSYFSTAPLTYQIQFLRLTSDWTYRGAILIKYLSNQTIIYDVMLKNKNRFPPYAVTLLLK